jgi:hypothetical protein
LDFHFNKKVEFNYKINAKLENRDKNNFTGENSIISERNLAQKEMLDLQNRILNLEGINVIV